jgi:hypothetical protein
MHQELGRRNFRRSKLRPIIKKIDDTNLRITNQRRKPHKSIKTKFCIMIQLLENTILISTLVSTERGSTIRAHVGGRQVVTAHQSPQPTEYQEEYPASQFQVVAHHLHRYCHGNNSRGNSRRRRVSLRIEKTQSTVRRCTA